MPASPADDFQDPGPLGPGRAGALEPPAGANLTAIDGTVDAMELSGMTTTTLTFNLDTPSIVITDPGSLQTIQLTGARTVDVLEVQSSGALTTIDTNVVDVTTINLHQDGTVPLSLTTLANDINVTAEANEEA